MPYLRIFQKLIVMILNIHYPVRRLLAFLWILSPLCVAGQIIPPGLGDIETGSWMALGLRQDIGNKNWSSTTYFGIAGRNGPDEINPFENHAAFVLNQEFKNRFHPKWEYSAAGSYRRQYQYEKENPQIAADPKFKQEFRIYGRFSYLYKTGKIEITPTFRQEVIKYYTPDFQDFPESLRLRSRFRIKAGLPLNPDKTHRLSLYSEQLFSVSQSGITGDWGDFRYSDSRFSIYYTWSPDAIPLSVDIGYMANVLGKKMNHTGHYLGVDLVIKNIF